MDSEQSTVNEPMGGDLGGQGPPKEAHTLTSKEAAQLFEQAGIPRSQRSIERYCESGKLDCIIDPDEKHWYASKKSVDLLIGQLKELQARHQPSELSEPGPTASANVGQVPTRPSKEQEEASSSSSPPPNNRKQTVQGITACADQ